MDDWDQKLYVDSPLVSGVLWVVPVFPASYFLAMIGDFLVVDAYHFWGKDLWRGEGTGFQHKEMKPGEYLRGVLVDEGGFMKTHKSSI